MDKTTLDIAGRLSDVFSLDEKENITIAGFTVDGAGNDAGDIVTAEDCKKITVDNVYIRPLARKTGGRDGFLPIYVNASGWAESVTKRGQNGV